MRVVSGIAYGRVRASARLAEIHHNKARQGAVYACRILRILCVFGCKYAPLSVWLVPCALVGFGFLLFVSGTTHHVWGGAGFREIRVQFHDVSRVDSFRATRPGPRAV